MNYTLYWGKGTAFPKIGKEILKDLGIEGEFIGVGHLALGYADMELPPIPPRKENRVYYIR